MAKLPKSLKYILVMFVAWKISDVLMELLYNSFDNAILSSPSSANGLLIALRSIVGFIRFDIVSFLIAVIVCLLVLFKSNSD